MWSLLDIHCWAKNHNLKLLCKVVSGIKQLSPISFSTDLQKNFKMPPTVCEYPRIIFMGNVDWELLEYLHLLWTLVRFNMPSDICWYLFAKLTALVWCQWIQNWNIQFLSETVIAEKPLHLNILSILFPNINFCSWFKLLNFHMELYLTELLCYMKRTCMAL